eukprot:NODE_1422_length_1168_cov_95.188561_g1166_i0.p1 GENE.NODE_1422_length_1168_cov_95.188561_g1166_i0~~NODE_1422_length_1168_cov_95.188561_g1166_i0.p1  ORF type:complete len:330 (+),score=73.99 NODE_1422_length_1168_cov_95.188561_g1166_i0:26-991(+)
MGEEVHNSPNGIFMVGILVMFFLVYPTMVREMALLLRCTQSICTAPGQCDTYVESDLAVSCSSSTYKNFSYLTMTFLALYGLGIPLFSAILIMRHRNELYMPNISSKYGFLYEGYAVNRYYWESVISTRKMFVVLASVIFASNMRHQVYATLMVLLSASALHLIFHPYCFRMLHNLESLSLTTLVITLNACLLYNQPNSNCNSVSSVVQVIVTITIAFLNLLAILVFLMFILKETKEAVYRALDADHDGEITLNEAKMALAESMQGTALARFMPKPAQQVSGSDEPRELPYTVTWDEVDGDLEAELPHHFGEYNVTFTDAE